LLNPVIYKNQTLINLPKYKRKPASKKLLVGVDVFVHWNGTNPNELADKLTQLEKTSKLKLNIITNRGIKVWPNGFKETFCTDHWRCRFKNFEDNEISKTNIIALLQQSMIENIDTIKTENLYSFDGKAGFSLGQGQ